MPFMFVVNKRLCLCNHKRLQYIGNLLLLFLKSGIISLTNNYNQSMHGEINNYNIHS